MKSFKLIQIYPKEKVKIQNLYKRYFFGDYEKEYCYKLENHIKYMQQNKIKLMKVWLAKREPNTPYSFCKYFKEFIARKNNNCGNSCLLGYEPRNGKNGICKHHGYGYEITDIYFTLILI